MESYTTVLFLPDEKEEDILRIKAFYSLGKNIKEDCLVRRGEGFVGWVFREQKSVLVSHFDKRDAAILKFYDREEKIKSLLISPLPHKAGALYVDSKKSYIFTDEKEKILNQMGKIIVSMLDDENEIKEKRRTEKYLDFSLKFLDIIVYSKNRNDLVEKILICISIFFKIQYVVFFDFGGKIYILNKAY
ncbi:MAG: GAF domain-containing protein, partial [Thermodesulfobacteriota bacterium]